MNKTVMKTLVLCAMLFCCTSGLAEFRPTGVKESCYMKIHAYCDSKKRFKDGTNWSLKNCGYDNHAIYVRHYVPHSTTPYTNCIKIRRVDSAGNTIAVYGEKWCTPGLNVPIQSDEIKMNQYYSVVARGNTCHYEYDGVDRVELRVNMYVNMNAYPKEKEVTTDDDLDHAEFD